MRQRYFFQINQSRGYDGMIQLSHIGIFMRQRYFFQINHSRCNDGMIQLSHIGIFMRQRYFFRLITVGPLRNQSRGTYVITIGAMTVRFKLSHIGIFMRQRYFCQIIPIPIKKRDLKYAIRFSHSKIE